MPWHQQPAEAVLQALRTSGEGLTAVEAERRLAEHGPNVLREGRRRTALGMLAGQFTDFMILVLLGAAVISGLIGDVVDTIAIVAIVVLNAVIGFVQEYRAERAMAALKAMAAPTATVLREGTTSVVAAAELVPGDVVLLEAGRIAPADLRLLEAALLRLDEAPLTGESVPVEKTVAPLPEGA
ncbi:MAG: HAD-IC family P-type ATPase, partial [Candidatus Rokubacteria bacterium]|nr:HAD-IC family P-type ATPase [Candidatus Rokubacteria bacterium]